MVRPTRIHAVPSRPSFRRLPPVLLVLALAPAGCGLADYEKKMRDADARVLRFDEENKLLGDPLVLPAKGPPVVVFLRPPRGVSTSPGNQPGDDPYHFPGTGGLCSDLILVFGDTDGGKDKLERQIEERFGVAGQPWQPITFRPTDRPALDFEAAEFGDARAPSNAPAVLIAYVHQSAGCAPVGMVFRVVQANRSGIDQTIKKSLESYAEAGDAAKARADFAKRSAH